MIVDTYAIVADLTGSITSRARSWMDSIRTGDVIGVVHYMIVFELAYLTQAGRLPFTSMEELGTFIELYFRVEPLTPNLALKAGQIKTWGDSLLKTSSGHRLRRRRLSVADATSIALAEYLGAPIITGDNDLAFIAGKRGIEIIW